MNERHHGDQIGQPLFLDEPPDLPRRSQPETSSVDALFADEDGPMPPGARGSFPAVRHGLRLPDSWSLISGHVDAPAFARSRGTLLIVLVLAAALCGFFAMRALLN
jgi:hypothetical protein